MIRCLKFLTFTVSMSFRLHFRAYKAARKLFNDQNFASTVASLQLKSTTIFLNDKSISGNKNNETSSGSMDAHIDSTLIPVDNSSSNQHNKKRVRGASGHIPLAQTLWEQIVESDDIVVDATCGNGNDSLFLARLALGGESGQIHCIDIQEDAIHRTAKKLELELGFPLNNRARYYAQNHKEFPLEIKNNSVKLICYNLGYLPGSGTKKEIKTNVQDTIESINNSLSLLCRYGLLSVTCYRGHEGGVEEYEKVSSFLTTLKEENWRVFSHVPLNRPLAPVLLTAFKII